MMEQDQETINGLDVRNDDDRIIKSNEEIINGEKGLDYGSNVHVLRENPKRSWRVSSSIKDYDYKRGHSMKNNVCKKCGKVFDSVKALHGHMRCHSIKRSQPLDESSERKKEIMHKRSEEFRWD
ncbi:hypothetical protein L1987_68307 [Smallanthus sonchifolius]|uniref:Uncharacterized protein n=1 Tax=Smallanthus sonchifolius TaxID=185202 RepID=A0ACB9B8J4_9ASTR|nr:hypothetical protein L1987_68307 [Smallanthus sonchifolius]